MTVAMPRQVASLIQLRMRRAMTVMRVQSTTFATRLCVQQNRLCAMTATVAQKIVVTKQPASAYFNHTRTVLRVMTEIRVQLVTSV